ncbi:hypothetical protein NE236_05520 [Actinoallomurus purpureus]|uniref:hypothetical protein n=1 Tax=Actinoallomurus purpureus TaxID=478114 RepID=UPI0020931496|nr:hypothetical protein [Actinoallomurus purpureus]MCO6004436.1 hypothetical protein [Actinoallomurus purpureus]
MVMALVLRPSEFDEDTRPPLDRGDGVEVDLLRTLERGARCTQIDPYGDAVKVDVASSEDGPGMRVVGG